MTSLLLCEDLGGFFFFFFGWDSVSLFGIYLFASFGLLVIWRVCFLNTTDQSNPHGLDGGLWYGTYFDVIIYDLVLTGTAQNMEISEQT